MSKMFKRIKFNRKNAQEQYDSILCESIRQALNSIFNILSINGYDPIKFLKIYIEKVEKYLKENEDAEKEKKKNLLYVDKKKLHLPFQ